MFWPSEPSVFTTLLTLVPLSTWVLAALIASLTLLLPVPPILLMVKVPSEATLALPPKILAVLAAALPITFCVA